MKETLTVKELYHLMSAHGLQFREENGSECWIENHKSGPGYYLKVDRMYGPFIIRLTDDTAQIELEDGKIIVNAQHPDAGGIRSDTGVASVRVNVVMNVLEKIHLDRTMFYKLIAYYGTPWE